MLTLKIENLETMRNAFAQAPVRIAPILQKAVVEAGKQTRNIEVKEAPHKTGTLQRSIKLNFFPIGFELYPTVNYAGYVVSGTQPHIIVPVRAKALRFKGRDGQYHYAKKVHHTGTKANPFVERTVDIATAPVNKVFNQALQEITKLLST